MTSTGNVTTVESLPAAPVRPQDSHKGTFGRALIVAGSRGMSGAACLSGCGALRSGAGLVTVGVPRSIQPAVAGWEPSYLTVDLPEDDGGRFCGESRMQICELAATQSSVAIGPGWGRSTELNALATDLFGTVREPMVVDADAINALADTEESLQQPAAGPRVLTPHPGEFARLIAADTATVQANREEHAVNFAREHHAVLVLKGHQTVITDGAKLATNRTGNHGLATGGSGDVLTGLVAGLLAQGMSPFEAAQLGAWLHGRAGDLAASDMSAPGLVASDLPRYVAKAWRDVPSG